LAAVGGCAEDTINLFGTSSGDFTAIVEGALTDTLRGTVTYRTQDGRLAGLELNVDSARGLSVELEPTPDTSAAPQTYEVVAPNLLGVPRTGERPGLAAFLVTREGEFRATAGTLRVTHRTDGRIGGVFTWEMVGTFEGVPGAVPSIRVSGQLQAVAQPR
jgi:hypothetical protein